MRLFKEIAAFFSNNPSCFASLKRHLAKKKRDRRDRRGGWTFSSARSGDSTDETTSEGSGSSDGAKYGDCDECDCAHTPQIPKSIEAGSWDACCRSDLRIPLHRRNHPPSSPPPPPVQQQLRLHPGKQFEARMETIDEESSSCCRSSSSRASSRCPSLVSEEEEEEGGGPTIDDDFLRKENAAVREEAGRQHVLPPSTSEEEEVVDVDGNCDSGARQGERQDASMREAQSPLHCQKGQRIESLDEPALEGSRSKRTAERPPRARVEGTDSDDSSESAGSDEDEDDNVALLCGLVLEQSFRSTYCI